MTTIDKLNFTVGLRRVNLTCLVSYFSLFLNQSLSVRDMMYLKNSIETKEYEVRMTVYSLVNYHIKRI